VDEAFGSRLVTRWFCLLSVPLVSLGAIAEIDGVGRFDVPPSLRSHSTTRAGTWVWLLLLVAGPVVFFWWSSAWMVVVVASIGLGRMEGWPYFCGRDVSSSFAVVTLVLAVSSRVCARRLALAPDERLRRRVFRELTGHTLDPRHAAHRDENLAELEESLARARREALTPDFPSPTALRDIVVGEMTAARLRGDGAAEADAFARLRAIDPDLTASAGRRTSPLLPAAMRALPPRHVPRPIPWKVDVVCALVALNVVASCQVVMTVAKYWGPVDWFRGVSMVAHLGLFAHRPAPAAVHEARVKRSASPDGPRAQRWGYR
jgi:hypothetical protein